MDLAGTRPSWGLESPPSTRRGVGGGELRWFSVDFEFRGSFCRLLIFLASEERVPKQLKQVSIEGTTFLNHLHGTASQQICVSDKYFGNEGLYETYYEHFLDVQHFIPQGKMTPDCSAESKNLPYRCFFEKVACKFYLRLKWLIFYKEISVGGVAITLEQHASVNMSPLLPAALLCSEPVYSVIPAIKMSATWGKSLVHIVHINRRE